MRVLIVGGGNVGYYLTKTLKERKNHIMIIEQDRVRCEQIEQDLGDSSIAVTNGDGTDTECLKEAGINDADVLIAVTGHDQNNLVACQIAKDFFGVKRTVARVKNPKNIVAFRKMGVDSVISSTEEIANTIDEQLDWSEMKRLVETHSADLRLNRIVIGRESKFAGHTLQEISFKNGIIIVALLRDGSVIVPDGKTVLNENDEVILWGKKDDLKEIQSDHPER